MFVQGIYERPHVEGKPCSRIAVHCTVCKASGHQASCHKVTAKEAKEEMLRKYGITFQFVPTTRKRMAERMEVDKEVKKVKKSDLESDED